jgi:putative FmdB family regulatory protein
MPIYAYKCSNCGFEKDELQKMSAAPLVDCPNCGQPELKKQLTAAGFQLKGSGWYVTDFRDGGKAPAATAVAPAAGGDAAAKPADAAPAAKADSPASSGDAKPASSESAKAPSTTSTPATPAAPSTGP